MGSKLNRPAYQRVIDEDIEWLDRQPRSLEREHIRDVLRLSPEREYETGEEKIYRMLNERAEREVALVEEAAITISTAIRAETHGLLNMIEHAIIQQDLQTLHGLLKPIKSLMLVGDPDVTDDEAFNVLRDFALTALRSHEVAQHSGAPCTTERANAVAYLAHVLGVRAFDVNEHVTPKIVDYESTCPQCTKGRPHVETAEPLTQVDAETIARKNRDEQVH